MQVGGNLSYRITHFSNKPLTLTAVYADGVRLCIAIKDSDEHQQEASGATLIGAYAESDGTLLMDTGKDAKNAYYSKEIGSSPKTRIDKTEYKHSVSKAEPPLKNNLAGSFVKERRWPPPPCAPNARFLNGRWVDQSIGV